MTERFMVDDAGTLIDMQTRDMFDIVEEVCPLLNRQHETIQRLEQNIDELLSVDIEEELVKENEQLKSLNIPIEEIKETVVDYKGRIVGVYYND